MNGVRRAHRPAIEITAVARYPHPSLPRSRGRVREGALDSIALVLLHRHMSKRPVLSPRKEAQRIVRNERLARALRDNLKRRKDQARAQAAAEAAGEVCPSLSGEALSGKSTDHGGTPAD